MLLIPLLLKYFVCVECVGCCFVGSFGGFVIGLLNLHGLSLFV